MRPTPVKNIVSEIHLNKADALLPIFELVANSIQSINLKYKSKIENGKITIRIKRYPKDDNPLDLKPFKEVTVIDNGEGFTENNLVSFETPHTHKNADAFGCKGMGRFTCIAAFKKMEIYSTYIEHKEVKHRNFSFDVEKELQLIDIIDDQPKEGTIIKLYNYRDPNVREGSKITSETFAEKLSSHCLIYYLENKLPEIIIDDDHAEEPISLVQTYNELSKEKERPFSLKNYDFKVYILTTSNAKRRIHYLHFCANSREIGEGKNLALVDSVFHYPLIKNGKHSHLDVYIVSEYLNKSINSTRNNLNLPTGLFSDVNTLTINDIETEVANLLKEKFEEVVLTAKANSVEKTRSFIIEKGIEYQRYLNREDILSKIPPHAKEEEIDSILHKIAYEEKKSIIRNLDEFIKTDSAKLDPQVYERLENDLRNKTAFDRDSLSEYMLRRKVVLQLFDRFLELDEKGEYKLEEHIHNLIIPMGISGNPGYLGHNLWLLDERFFSFNFVASDIPLSKVSDKNSTKEPDVLLWKEGVNILDKPTLYATGNSGNLGSLVVFEFKRPGETAHQKNKTNYNWLLSELVEKYFHALIYGDKKKSHSGKTIVVEKTTPKFGYIIVDVLHPELKTFNKDQGFNETPYGTLFKIIPALNLHVEVITFHQLIDQANQRHKPFFDRLFG